MKQNNFVLVFLCCTVLCTGCWKEKITPEIAFNYGGEWVSADQKKKFIFDFVVGEWGDEEHYRFFENDPLRYDLVLKKSIDLNKKKLSKVVETKDGSFIRFKLIYDRKNRKDTLEITGPVSNYTLLSSTPLERYARVK